ncbi:MAG: hypothetical protein ACYTE3_07550 [Planctomycetota bacterium]
MVFWLNFAWWGYHAIWAVLLIHCLLKRKFFPLFGRGWGTKIFWLITFVFRNPLLTLLYVIFAVILKAEEKNQRRILAGGAMCLVFVLLVIAVDLWPKPDWWSNDITTVRAGQEKEEEKGFGFQDQVGALQANNSISTVTSSSKSGNAKFCAKSIIIRSKSDHLVIDKACRFMQEKIVELPYVDEVQYWPFGIETDDPLSRADVIVVVDARKIAEGGFGITRKLEANVTCFVGTEPVEKFDHTHYSNTPPVIRFSMNSSLQHRSVFKGFESSKVKYKQQSESIGEQFAEAIKKQFDKWVEDHGLLPELPEYMYSREVREVGFRFLKARNAKRLYHGGGLLMNYCAVWSYEDQHSNDTAFREVRDILRQQEWSGGNELDNEAGDNCQSFTMSKGDEHIQIFRERGRRDSGGIFDGDDGDLEKKLPIIVEYSSLFTREQMDDVLGRLFASEADLDTKLIFENFSSDENVRQLLLDAVETQQVKTMDGYLLIGQHHAGKDDKAKATEALMMARAMGRAEKKHNPASNEIKSLAKKIGDESLAKAEVGVEYYRRAGFIDLSTANDGVEYERAADEPLMFYAVSADEEGVEKAGIKTIVLRIGKVSGAEDQYELETITKQGGSSSTGKRGLDSSIILHDSMGHKVWFTLNVEKLGGERFRLTVRKK